MSNHNLKAAMGVQDDGPFNPYAVTLRPLKSTSYLTNPYTNGIILASTILMIGFVSTDQACLFASVAKPTYLGLLIRLHFGSDRKVARWTPMLSAIILATGISAIIAYDYAVLKGEVSYFPRARGWAEVRSVALLGAIAGVIPGMIATAVCAQVIAIRNRAKNAHD